MDLSKIARALDGIEVREAGDAELDYELNHRKKWRSDDADVPWVWVLACQRMVRH
ncbi:hypothetical protein [Hydrogenophaga sp. PAMC20947]|uniref:hypothetical protein n=1 Tax=Hydrogenophaga sp. PAMC20947 TaxID=2565558 RepID=UPI001446DBC4|nr:hypothetical protein [Hydrogenophaga sp. PAMC20947]